MSKEQIFVRVPCAYFVSAAVTSFLCGLERLGADPTCPYEFNVGLLVGFKPVDYARNVIVQQFLESEATKLWFVDSDLIPAPNTAQLLFHDYDIVGAPYPFWGQRKNDWPPDATWGIYNWKETGPMSGFHQPPAQEKGVQLNDAVGTGMMIIKRRLFEDERMLATDSRYQRINEAHMTLEETAAKPFFRNIYKPNGAFEATEDLDFCYRAMKLGYRLAIDHGVKCGHIKQANVSEILDFAIRSYRKGWKDYDGAVRSGRLQAAAAAVKSGAALVASDEVVTSHASA